MMRNWKRAFWAVLVVPFVVLTVWLFRLDHDIEMQISGRRGESLHLVVMDPLCGEPASGDAQSPHRDYAPLATSLEKALGWPVTLSCGRHLSDVLPLDSPADLIVGRDAAVPAEVPRLDAIVRRLARLTDEDGSTDIAGVFIVRAKDRARTIGDLVDHRIVFGPTDDRERHSWALTALSQAGITPVPPLRVAPTCREAIQMVARNEVDAAVISSYDLAMIEGGDANDVGTFRVVGRTTSQPFLTVFATGRIGPAAEQAITEALLSVKARPRLLEALRSKDGFVPLKDQAQQKTPPPAPAPAPAPTTFWTDWRGPNRAGISPDVPETLPSHVQILWKRGLTGAGLSGVAATATHVIVADKSEQKDRDIWRCLDAETGQELWTISYATPTQMEFTNVPRAAPVIHGSFVYLLGAFGDLHCVGLYGSGILWRRNIIEDFGARLPTWGTCSTPLVVGDSLIVNPGAPDASLVALSLYTGEALWKTPGGPPGYGSLILGTFGGVRQIVGHDADSLGGWDPNTGQRLWTLTPEKKGDYNVPTPVDVRGRLLVATENNGTRLYDFNPDGRIRPVPVEQTSALAPDTSTPVVVDGLVFGCYRGLFCLDIEHGLRTLYSAESDGAFKEYAALIAGPNRVLAVTVGGELILFEAARDTFRPIGRLQVFHDTEVWSHPALVGNHLYLRSMNEICCLLLSDQ